jgi:hypothetical protein
VSNRLEAGLSVLAALLVLFTALLDPRISAALAVLALAALGIYHFTRR